MKRGEIRWATLPPATGSGPGYRRPVLIVQSNAFNHSKISTVLVAVISSNLALADAPGNLKLGKSRSSLPRASVVNVSQLITLDRQYLGPPISRMSASVMERVNAGLKLALGLS